MAVIESQGHKILRYLYLLTIHEVLTWEFDSGTDRWHSRRHDYIFTVPSQEDMSAFFNEGGFSGVYIGKPQDKQELRTWLVENVVPDTPPLRTPQPTPHEKEQLGTLEKYLENLLKLLKIKSS